MTDNFAHRAAEWDSSSKIEMTEKFSSALRKKIAIQKNWKALEVGAGTGLVGLQILPEINSIVFEDTSEAMLGVLKQKLKGNENVEILTGEVTDYKNFDIDFVFSCMAFHHIPDTEKTLQHLFEITKTGAVIAIGDIRTEDGSFHHFEPIPHKGFDTDELSEKFRKAGFDVLSADTYNVLERERVPGVMGKYEQFLLIALKK